MSLCEVVDRRYRLNPADLAGRTRPVIVCSVTYEGLEELRPLVHFEGLGRPLSLDPDQRLDMARITHSTLLVDWVGASLVLRPVRRDGRESIRLLGRDEYDPYPLLAPAQRRAPALPVRTILRLLAVIFLIVAAFAAVSMVETATNFQALLDVLFQ